MNFELKKLNRAVGLLVLLCSIGVTCSARKLSLNKPYPYTKYSTITFKAGDSCIITDVLNTSSVLKWKYHHDTIVVSSIYKRNRIEDVSHEVVDKHMDNILIHVNNPSKLAVVHMLDGNFNEIKNVVLAFSNEVKYEHRFRYCSVQLHNGVSKPLSLEKLNGGGGVVKIFVDYPPEPDKYPYDLYEKFVISGRKLVKVR